MATGSRLIESAALANGLKLRYLEQGDPSGVAVVLLHAFADSWRSFERLLPCLPRSIRAFTVTQRGHGDAGLRRRGLRPDAAGTSTAVTSGTCANISGGR
jgi:non-heme chloroperoxidase